MFSIPFMEIKRYYFLKSLKFSMNVSFFQIIYDMIYKKLCKI